MSKHLKVLRDRHLIEEERPAEDARVRVYRLRPERLEELKDWLSDVGAFWSDQLGAFKTAADGAAKRDANERAKGAHGVARTHASHRSSTKRRT
jgi:DNA-binding MarR family transcriptional regulator